MSLGNVREYFQNTLDPLNFREHTDGFDFTNIPDNLLDNAYFISFGGLIGGPVNQFEQKVEVPVELRIFIKGYNSPQKAIDQALVSGESIIKEICKIDNRLNNNLCIKNVVFDTMEIEPLNKENDNSLILLINFDVLYMFALK